MKTKRTKQNKNKKIQVKQFPIETIMMIMMRRWKNSLHSARSAYYKQFKYNIFMRTFEILPPFRFHFQRTKIVTLLCREFPDEGRQIKTFATLWKYLRRFTEQLNSTIQLLCRPYTAFSENLMHFHFNVYCFLYQNCLIVIEQTDFYIIYSYRAFLLEFNQWENFNLLVI